MANLTHSGTSHSKTISTTVGGGMATGTNARIDMVPIISGGTLTGIQMDYVDERTLGSSSGGDAQSEGLTRTFAGYTTDSARWTFNGVLDVDLHGSLHMGASSPLLVGTITDTIGRDGFSAIDNDDSGAVYIFDDLKIRVQLTGDAVGQSVSCVAGGVSFVIMHKVGDSNTMACDLNSDCACL